jgi:uncharacterized protein (DUF952 family)
MTDKIAYKVFTADEWVALNAGAFEGSPTDKADGFIHLSTAAQLTETVDRHFSGQEGLVIAAIDLAATLGGGVRWEPSRNGQLFPHVYGQLTPQSVIASCSLERHPNGTVRLPTGETYRSPAGASSCGRSTKLGT